VSIIDRAKEKGAPAARPLAERFWPKTEPATDLSPNGMAGCIVWTGALTDGYGLIYVGPGRYARAHRAAWELSDRDLTEGLELDHLCRRRACVNVDHLELVTCAENLRRGARTKLTTARVAEIRYLFDAGWNRQAIADAYGISHSYVHNLGRGRRWA
jgi:hypothetical protein